MSRQTTLVGRSRALFTLVVVDSSISPMALDERAVHPDPYGSVRHLHRTGSAQRRSPLRATMHRASAAHSWPGSPWRPGNPDAPDANEEYQDSEYAIEPRTAARSEEHTS